MENKEFSRRKFIKGTVGAGLLVTGSGLFSSGDLFSMPGSDSRFDAKGLPTALLGKTGVRIPRMAIGLGSRFCNIQRTEDAVVRPRETLTNLDPADLVRYALSLDGPDGIVLGMDSMEVVKSNLDILRSFRPMDELRMKQMAFQLTPYYKHENLPWMKPGYCDGNWS